MEMSLIYTMLPFIGATYGGFVLRDIIDYIKQQVGEYSVESYKANEIMLEELPQLLDYPEDFTSNDTKRRPVFDFSEINTFDKKKLKSPTETIHIELSTEEDGEKDLIKELQARLKTIRKCTEPFA